MIDESKPATPATEPTPKTATEPCSAAEFRRKAHSWLNRAQADVEFALGAGAARIERSTFGTMVERAQLYAFDSDGRPLPRRSDGQMKIKHQAEEPGYDLDFETLARIGRGHKLLDIVGSKSKLLRATLEAYHGERGARWGREMRDDNSGGVGNRDVAVYPLTEMGRKWVAALRTKFPISGALRADEVLANEYAMGKRTRDDIRMHRLSRCAIEARALITEAHAVLEAAAEHQRNSARQIRQASIRAERRAV